MDFSFDSDLEVIGIGDSKSEVIVPKETIESGFEITDSDFKLGYVLRNDEKKGLGGDKQIISAIK